MPGDLPFQARAAGVLLHLTSLPGGVLDGEAERFVDWLAEAGQSWWQILPLAPPDGSGSPYAGRSAFAAWPGLLATHGDRVAPAEVTAFRAAHPMWADGWEAYAGPDALADQVRFARRWSRLREHAHARGVRILGDMPLYVAADGADRRAWPGIFRADGVAGVPPDYFSDDGQLWGNPLFDWDALRADGFRWWVERVRRGIELHDAVRIDHFRGLAAYWNVPAGAETAREGRWCPGPGIALIEAIRRELGPVPLVAEDLGIITPDVEELRVAAGVPGMVVMQFEVQDRPAQDARLWHETDRIAYPGTHDNATAEQWWSEAGDAQRWNVRETARRAGTEAGEGGWALVRLAHAAPATTAIVPAQDVLGLGAEARMNTPSTTEGNWGWRLRPGQLTPGHARRLRELTAEFGRLP